MRILLIALMLVAGSSAAMADTLDAKAEADAILAEHRAERAARAERERLERERNGGKTDAELRRERHQREQAAILAEQTAILAEQTARLRPWEALLWTEATEVCAEEETLGSQDHRVCRLHFLGRSL